jgi:hypothetical protein
MKVFLLALIVAVAFAKEQGKAAKPQTKAAAFTYPAGSTAAYPPQTGLIYNANTLVKYVAGATVTFPYQTTVNFLYDSQFYVQQGPVSVLANTSTTFGAGAQVAFPPGTNVKFITNLAEVRYLQFNGNTHTIAQYPSQTPAQYYCTNCNLILFQAGTNPLVYYNPGAGTQFGQSGLPVETPEVPKVRTYGGYYSMGCGYCYCSGYSYGGYPQTTYSNYNTGYSSTAYQTGASSYTYGGGTGGGYSMAGGSTYGGGAYYGSYGGGTGGGTMMSGGGGSSGGYYYGK